MKKLISALLALVLVLSLATVAFAAEEETTTTYTDMSTVTLSKTYNDVGDTASSPAEIFSFSTLTCTSVEDAAVGITAANAPVPTIGSVEYVVGEAGSGTKTKDVTITLPTYTGVGIYTYTFTESAGNTAGVEYYAKTITLVVTVIQDGEGKLRVAAVHTEEDGEAKSNAITNTYSAGELDVTKTVTGILGDKTKDFAFTVVFTAPANKTVKSSIPYSVAGTAQTPLTFADGSNTLEVNFNLKDGQTATFDNLPAGVTYVVTETDYTADGYETTKTGDTGTISATTKSEANFTNNKDGDVDTGISLDSMPFVLMLVVCAGAAVLFVTKRRSVEF